MALTCCCAKHTGHIHRRQLNSWIAFTFLSLIFAFFKILYNLQLILIILTLWLPQASLEVYFLNYAVFSDTVNYLNISRGSYLFPWCQPCILELIIFIFVLTTRELRSVLATHRAWGVFSSIVILHVPSLSHLWFSLGFISLT
jgi:hypothetical protein